MSELLNQEFQDAQDAILKELGDRALSISISKNPVIKGIELERSGIKCAKCGEDIYHHEKVGFYHECPLKEIEVEEVR